MQYTDQADTQGMDIMMTRTTTIRHTDTTVTDPLFHSVSSVVVLTTTDTTATDHEVSEGILSTIEISTLTCPPKTSPNVKLEFELDKEREAG